MPDELSDEVPEADALEQRQEVAPGEGATVPDEGLEVPEADALDQAREAPLDEDR